MYIILKRLHAHLDMISTHHCDHYRYPIIDKDIPCCMQPRSSFWIILVFCCSFQEWSQSIQGECVQHHNASLHLHKTKPSCSLLSFPIIISFPFKTALLNTKYLSVFKHDKTIINVFIALLVHPTPHSSRLTACKHKHLSNGVLSTLNYYLQFWRHFQSSHFFFIPISCILLSLC